MPKHYPELFGTNNKCAKCNQDCKQWKQIKVIICPNFKPCGQQSGTNTPEPQG